MDINNHNSSVFIHVEANQNIHHQLLPNKFDADFSKNIYEQVHRTYLLRIKAADRLRHTYASSKQLNTVLAAYVTVGSILTIRLDYLSPFVLSASVALNYYSFYLSDKNLQERAYRMENCYKRLGELKNKINLATQSKKIALDSTSYEDFYEEYNRIIDGVENHIEIDKYKYIAELSTISNGQNSSPQEEALKYFSIPNKDYLLKKIDEYNTKEKLKKYIIYILSTIMLLLLIRFSIWDESSSIPIKDIIVPIFDSISVMCVILITIIFPLYQLWKLLKIKYSLYLLKKQKHE